MSYGDTHRHRLGTNYNQIPVNRPIVEVRNYQRDGPQCIFSQGDAPNYFPNSFNGPQEQRETGKCCGTFVSVLVNHTNICKERLGTFVCRWSQ